jgi:polysaccharide biosynthesis/export protein
MNRKQFDGFHLRIRLLAFLCLSLFLLEARSHSQQGSASGQQSQHPLSAGATGAQSTSSQAGKTTVAPQDISNVKLMPGSMVQIHVFEEADLDGTYRLDAQGNIALPLAGAVPLQSLTLREAEAAIRGRLLGAQVLKVANVVVNLDEYSTPNTTVMGEVAAPGPYPIIGPRKLIEVLSMAGGETQLAGNEIVIQRAGTPLGAGEAIHYNRYAGDSSPLNVAVNPGDTVIVKRAGIVYVLGAVNRPGGYVMQEAGELNIDQALAMASGTAPEAKVGDLRVFRKNADGSVLEINLSYKKINKGEQEAIKLRAQDIVYVPVSAVKEVFMRGGTAIFNAAASAAVYNVAY